MIAVSSSAPEQPEGPRDLRSELFEALSTHFTAALEADGSIPESARNALAALLNSDDLSASDILTAASMREEVEQEKEAQND